MNIQIYACYLSGSTAPDYIGSHNPVPKAGDRRDAWKYANLRYMGQGIWLHKDTGELVCSSQNKKDTRWGSLLVGLSPEQRMIVRVEVLTTVDMTDRWKVEGEMIRLHKPPYNAQIPMDPEVRRLKENEYERNRRKLNRTDETRAKHREYMRKYRNEHTTEETRAKRNEYVRKYRKEHANDEQRIRYNERHNQYGKEYYIRNPDKWEAKKAANRLRMKIKRAKLKAEKASI